MFYYMYSAICTVRGRCEPQCTSAMEQGTRGKGKGSSGYMIEMQVSDVVGVEDRMTELGARILLRPGRDGKATPVEYAVRLCGVLVRFVAPPAPALRAGL